MNFLDSSGKIIHSEKMTSPYTWAKIRSNSVMGALLSIACELVERKTVALMAPIPIPDEQIQLEKAAKFAVSFAESLERAKDFKPIIQRFFAADYLKGYLRDQDTNWFLNLNRDTAAKASHAQLQRFYVAFLNTGYLTSLYLISQSRLDDGESKVNEKLIPPDVFQLIENHPYTAAYRNKRETYDYLAENIDSLQRLRMYTDLLERLAVLMRKHVESAGAEHSTEYQGVLEEWDWSHSLYRPTIRTCATECFGFAKGTRLFEVDVPMFHLQFAQIKGQLRVVSAMDYFQ